MSAVKYHINKHGQPAECEASVQSCKAQGGGEHFDNFEDARIAAEQKLSQEHGTTVSVKKPAGTVAPEHSTVSTATQQATVTEEAAAQQRSQAAQKISRRASTAEKDLRSARNRFNKDDARIVEKLNETLPAHAAMANVNGTVAKTGNVAVRDQAHPHTIVYHDPETGRSTNFHYTQKGKLGKVTGEYRSEQVSKDFEQQLTTDDTLNAQIRSVAVHRIKTDVTTRREHDMRRTRLETKRLAEGQNGDISKVAQNIKSVERFQQVPEQDMQQFGKDINEHSRDVQVTEVKPRSGGPSQFFIGHDGDQGVDVTDFMTDRSNRYNQAGMGLNAAIHRDATIAQLEAIQQESAKHRE